MIGGWAHAAKKKNSLRKCNKTNSQVIPQNWNITHLIGTVFIPHFFILPQLAHVCFHLFD